MGRPCRGRWVGCNPRVTFFKPAGVPAARLEVISVPLDELEAMRLVDADGLDQIDAAEKMQVSRSTVGRLLEEGRAKIVRGLVEGKALMIEQGKAPVYLYNDDESEESKDN